jgi:hypothetical protein
VRAAAHLEAHCAPGECCRGPNARTRTHGRRGQAWGEIITSIQSNMPGPDRSSEQRISSAQQVATTVQNFGAAKRPLNSTRKLCKEIGEVLGNARIAQRIRNNDPRHSSPDELKASLAVDIDRPNKVVEDANVERM